MSLLSVYEAHAAVCSKMAASARDMDIRNRWAELADQWRQKARACEGLPTAPRPSQPSLPKIADAPLLPIAAANKTPEAPVPPLEPAKVVESHANAGDHDWKRLLADIRGK